ncbi:MAG: helix-turn-helix transcriptional regulator [Filimonas sp.]|nr:helix-turn-helix transcriptional regulator [Filimonas sp.]
MELAVKNMVCNRCIKVVKDVLHQQHINYTDVIMGKVILPADLTASQSEMLKQALLQEGFDVVEDKKALLVEKIKNTLIDIVYNQDLSEWKQNLSDYLSHLLHKDYTTLSQVFSSLENTTIEQYFILQKIERVKELLVYNEYSLSEIAWQLGYSSVAHLSAQFKKITGFTPSAFRNLKDHQRKSIDEI